MYAVAKGMGIPYSTVESWVKGGWTAPRYSDAVKDEVVRRVEAGENRAAVARDTGIRYETVVYWVRTRKRGSAGGGKAGTAGRGRRAKSVTARKTTGPPRPTRSVGIGEAISWALQGDVLVLRVPLGRVARRAAALKVLAAIKRELRR
jgi:transposase-like protein